MNLNIAHPPLARMVPFMWAGQADMNPFTNGKQKEKHKPNSILHNELIIKIHFMFCSQVSCFNSSERTAIDNEISSFERTVDSGTGQIRRLSIQMVLFQMLSMSSSTLVAVLNSSFYVNGGRSACCGYQHIRRDSNLK